MVIERSASPPPPPSSASSGFSDDDSLHFDDGRGMTLEEFAGHVKAKSKQGLYLEYADIKAKGTDGTFNNSRWVVYEFYRCCITWEWLFELFYIFQIKRQRCQESLHGRFVLRSQPGRLVDGGFRRPLLGLHQRQLRRRLQTKERFHLDTGPATKDVRRLLADDLGAAVRRGRHDDALPGERKTQVRSVLASGRRRISRIRPFRNHQPDNGATEWLHHFHAPSDEPQGSRPLSTRPVFCLWTCLNSFIFITTLFLLFRLFSRFGRRARLDPWRTCSSLRGQTTECLSLPRPCSSSCSECVTCRAGWSRPWATRGSVIPLALLLSCTAQPALAAQVLTYIHIIRWLVL